MIDASGDRTEDRSFEAYREEYTGAPFTVWLRERSEPEWTAAVHHPFTKELSREELDQKRFRTYLVQDLDFVDVLVRAFGYLIGQAESMETRSRVAQFLAMVTSDENDYFERSLEALDADPKQLEDSERNRTNAEFQTFLMETAQSGILEQTLAVLLAAEWVYAAWAEEVSDADPEAFYFREWIELHHNPAFNEFVDYLRSRMDELGPELSPEEQEAVAERFSEAVRFEVDFFDAVYET